MTALKTVIFWDLVYHRLKKHEIRLPQNFAWKLSCLVGDKVQLNSSNPINKMLFSECEDNQ